MKKFLSVCCLVIVGLLLLMNLLLLVSTSVPEAQAYWLKIGAFTMNPQNPCDCPEGYTCYCWIDP